VIFAGTINIASSGTIGLACIYDTILLTNARGACADTDLMIFSRSSVFSNVFVFSVHVHPHYFLLVLLLLLLLLLRRPPHLYVFEFEGKPLQVGETHPNRTDYLAHPRRIVGRCLQLQTLQQHQRPSPFSPITEPTFASSWVEQPRHHLKIPRLEVPQLDEHTAEARSQAEVD
jgi:hypothetical protein